MLWLFVSTSLLIFRYYFLHQNRNVSSYCYQTTALKKQHVSIKFSFKLQKNYYRNVPADRNDIKTQSQAMHESFQKPTSLKAVGTKLLTTDTMSADKQLNFLLRFLLYLTNKCTKYLLTLIYVKINKYFFFLSHSLTLHSTKKHTHTNTDWINMQPHDRSGSITMYFNWLF